MKNLFLKAKHWQLFLLMFGIPMISSFIFIGIMVNSFTANPNPDPFIFFTFMKFFPFIMILNIFTLYGWFWSISTGLQNKVPEGVKMKVGKFKIFFFMPLLYMLIILVGMVLLIYGIFEGGGEPNLSAVGGIVAVIIPLHLFSMFCIFYSLYFVAKTIKTVELQREVSFSEFIGEFFMIWFYPIGVWMVQPKINKWAETESGVATGRI